MALGKILIIESLTQLTLGFRPINHFFLAICPSDFRLLECLNMPRRGFHIGRLTR